MLRTDYLRAHQLKYRPKYIYAEDYKLWSDIACLDGVLYIIPKPLLEYRISEGQVSRVHNQQQIETAGRIRNELFNKEKVSLLYRTSEDVIQSIRFAQ